MKKNVLIVDDDQVWLKLIQKKFEKYSDTFHAHLAEDGLKAMEKLKANHISLVVTDLQMPNMDGITLLTHLVENYPDIPVIIVTAYSTPESKKTVLSGGAAGYIEKPFVIEDLAKKIIASLKRESEGGTLQTVPLEMFIQLIEMEQKTCTLRVTKKSTGKTGVLFFRTGDLLEARFNSLTGKEAAYEIFGWEDVVLSIQDDCVLVEKRIDDDLQAILLDAMRLKDENRATADSLADSRTTGSTGPQSPARLKGSRSRTAAGNMTLGSQSRMNGTTRERTSGFQQQSSPKKLTLEDKVRRKLKNIPGAGKSIDRVKRDKKWNEFIAQADKIGKSFGAGKLKVCFVDREEACHYMLVPTREPVEISVKPDGPIDKMLLSLSE